MEIRKPNLSSAGVILMKRLKKQGICISHSEALEHAAAMEGFQSHQAYKVHQSEQEKPYLVSEGDASGATDYRYVGPRRGSVWIRMRNISVYIKDNDEGVSVDLFDSGLESQGSDVGTWQTYAEALGNQLDAADELDDVKEHLIILARNEGVVLKASASNPEEWTWSAPGGLTGGPFETEWEAWAHACEAIF